MTRMSYPRSDAGDSVVTADGRAGAVGQAIAPTAAGAAGGTGAAGARAGAARRARTGDGLVQGRRRRRARLEPVPAQLHDPGFALPPGLERRRQLDRATAAGRFVGHHLLLGDVHADVDAAAGLAPRPHRLDEVGHDAALDRRLGHRHGVAVRDAQVLDRLAIRRRLQVALDDQRLTVPAQEERAVAAVQDRPILHVRARPDRVDLGLLAG